MEGQDLDNNYDDDDTNEPHSGLGGGDAGIKIPGKLRKIERDALKSEKPTGDGIKSSTDGSYQCQFCDKSFPRLGYLKKHEQSHAEHLPFKCDYCARLFKHKRSRDRHTKLHTGDRRYRCPHCEAAFSRSDHLKIHMKTHDTQKPFQCTVCNRGYNTAAALTSHMQNHKKQAALLGTGQTFNYSPRSTGSGSSSGSFHKRRYAMTDCSPSARPDYRKHRRIGSFIACIYCTKSDFTSLEQLNAHIQSMHEQTAATNATKETLIPACPPTTSVFQLSCEYCTMKFPNIPTMFQHMRTTHIDRLTSPNSYFEHFNRLAASGTFSPRLLTNTSLRAFNSDPETKIKVEQPSPNQDRRSQGDPEKDEEQTSPTDLSQPKKRQTPQQREGQGGNGKNPGGAFLCNQCNAALPDFDTFRAHLKSHITQETASLVCPHCGLTLRDSAEQERHIISHFLITNSEFACSYANCKKTFAKAEELQKHLFDSHIQVMYKCSVCSDIFDTKVAIQVHFACAHSNESKLFRCSACMETFGSEKEFSGHVRARHSSSGSAIQCIFCRAVCSSELEMHFHLAAHARQFRCPACPETFHVEFLLDRHMQTHHSQKDGIATTNGAPAPPPATSGATASDTLPRNSYHGAFNKQSVVPNNNNNNILEYNALASKSLLQFPGSKFYSPLQVDTTAVGSFAKHSALMYGLSQRYFEANKTLMDIYNYNQENKNVSPYFLNPGNFETTNRTSAALKPHHPSENKPPSERTNTTGFSCGICERSDFRTENDVHSHRKIVHNLKTGVSLRCAYCNGNFKSRSELEHHMKTCHNSTGKHKCLICDEIFPSPAVLAEHKLQHSKVGQSGKCSHCSQALNDVGMFKSHLNEHNPEGQIPVQCICCRQTLHSDFEVGLHAKFHTKSASSPENLCALCLETLPATSDSRVCEKCCRKHNLNSKFNIRNLELAGSRTYVENRCNLCKMILPHAQRLQEHLVEHTFVGCEERGYSCYICSAVFTVPAGLLSHMLEHGLHARPYDCNLCSEKYFFRAELDNHLIEHEILGRSAPVPENGSCDSVAATTIKSEHTAEATKDLDNSEKIQQTATENKQDPVKTETIDDPVEKTTAHEDDEEEYIEVEQIPEGTGNSKTQD
ncbi:unnamed protein product [Hermetia illucens]|uniref:C2H2-type domain-containing protein n=2 Tax=Hermetia illucens TaxID=343691 RepID=A0A7R8UYK1_HERIL|nr:unnamed protein product [Hermetia illucens]